MNLNENQQTEGRAREEAAIVRTYYGLDLETR